MKKNRVPITSVVFGLGFGVAVVACGGASSDPLKGQNPEGASSGQADASALPPGAYAGSYEVPVPAELSAAATYRVAEIEWNVGVDGVTRLEYDLPLGLVGTSLRVEFTGTFDSATQRANLTGGAGTANCTATATEVVCRETMRGLLPIAADMGLVTSIAAAEYPGPAQHRVDVAQRFIGDPIGILHIDLRSGTSATDPPDDKKGKDEKRRGNDKP